VTFAAGRYRFTVVTDDGSRLWVDDQLRIDRWDDQPPATFTVDVDLTAGAHAVRYEYYERGGGATAHLSWDLAPTTIPADHWKAEYFSNADLSGTPTSTADEGTGFVDHVWGGGGPSGLPADNFSARYTRTVTFAAGRYQFTIYTDDGSRLYIDDQLRIDGWGHQTWQYGAEIELTGGPHVLRYEHHEHTGAAWAHLDWAAVAPNLTAPVGASGPYSPAPFVEAPTPPLAAPHALAPAPPTVTEIVEYYHVDALGSVRVVTDGAGQVLRHHDFLPFGEEWQPPPSSPDQRLFTGKERDVESGLDYFGARYYRADLGRFTSVDPERSPQKVLVIQRNRDHRMGP
jgi:RHS repeat-associated protein